MCSPVSSFFNSKLQLKSNQIKFFSYARDSSFDFTIAQLIMANIDLAKMNLFNSSASSPILNVASLLDPRSIPEEILTQNPEVAIDIGFPQTTQIYVKELAELTQSSTLTSDADTKELSMDKRIQAFVRVKMKKTPHLLGRTFDAAIRLVSSVWPYVTATLQPGYANYTRIDRWGQCEKILPHILMLKNVFIAYKFIESKDIGSKKEFLVLLSELAWYVLSKSILSLLSLLQVSN